MSDDLPPAIPAATLVIFREAAAGAPELLMVERAATMAFAAGALVFPGGRVDPGDRALAAASGGEADDTAARIAAIRETVEETGVAIGIVPPPAPQRLDALRRRLLAGEPMAEALTAEGLSLDLAALEPFARWRPQHRHQRIYDTRFYLAALPAGAPPASVDATENVGLFWASAADVLATVTSGRAAVIFPTRRNLERLARFATFADAVADARSHPVETITPWIEARDGADHLCIPDHLGYPVTSEPLESASRG